MRREFRAAGYAVAMALVLLLAPSLISALSESIGRAAASAIVAFPPALAAAVLVARRRNDATPSGDRMARPSKPGGPQRRVGPAQDAADEHM